MILSSLVYLAFAERAIEADRYGYLWKLRNEFHRYTSASNIIGITGILYACLKLIIILRILNMENRTSYGKVV